MSRRRRGRAGRPRRCRRHSPPWQARYFSPKQHNTPDSFDRLFALNDVELYDLVNDPLERNNLALDRERNRALLDMVNAKLNALIAREVGEDVGQMLPGGAEGGWVATDAANDV